MSSFYYHNGLGNVGSYQVSARPFLTSSLEVPASGSTVKTISFETVTRFITITNTLAGGDPPAPLRFGFSEAGLKGSAGPASLNYAVLNNGESFTAEFRVIAVHLMGDSALPTSASVVAGLTSIDEELLSTNWSGSTGVG